MAVQTVGQLEVRIDNHDKEISDIRKILQVMQHRPPVWCTGAMTILGTAFGSAVTGLIASLL